MPIILNLTSSFIEYPNLGSFTPVFNGPDFSPLSILQTATGSKDVGALFSVQQGTMTFTNVGASPVGVTFNNGIYSWAGAVTPGTYSMITRATGSGIPATHTDFAWTLIVNTSGSAPVFTGPIPNQSGTGTFTFDVSTYATGETSITKSPAVTGITVSTAGIFTVTGSTTGSGTFGPFTVTYTNSFGSTQSNSFTIQVLPASGLVKKDFVGHWVRLTGSQTTATTQNALNDAYSNAQLQVNGTTLYPIPTPANPQTWDTLGGNNPGGTLPTRGDETGYQTNMLTGFIYNYPWWQLEPTAGDRSIFNPINGTNPGGLVTQNLTWCAQRGLFFIIMIDDRTFNYSKPDGTLTGEKPPLPTWMDNLNTNYPMQLQYVVGAGNNQGGTGFTAMRHKPEFITRMNLLVDAINAAYGDPTGNKGYNAYFHGISFQESAPGSITGNKIPAPYPWILDGGVNWDASPNYTAALYATALKSTMGHANTVLKTARVYWMQNFLPNGSGSTPSDSSISSVMQTVGKDIRIGGPDLKPDTASLTGGGGADDLGGGGIHSNFDGAGINTGTPPVWGNKTACYNNYTNNQLLASPPPIAAVQFGARTFCTVANDDIDGNSLHTSPYKPRSAATGGTGAVGAGTNGALLGTTADGGPYSGRYGWEAGDILDWGRRNLQIDSIWWYDNLIGNNNKVAKCIFYQRPGFNHST